MVVLKVAAQHATQDCSDSTLITRICAHLALCPLARVSAASGGKMTAFAVPRLRLNSGGIELGYVLRDVYSQGIAVNHNLARWIRLAMMIMSWPACASNSSCPPPAYQPGDKFRITVNRRLSQDAPCNPITLNAGDVFHLTVGMGTGGRRRRIANTWWELLGVTSTGTCVRCVGWQNDRPCDA